ncbi:MAG: hypothetical protein ACFFDT_00105 [Candidatus Hodarchaeota archaeon]
MKQKQKKAVLVKLVQSLQKRGSWCGETHIQKATYCLQEITGVPLEFDFILYKHGPFSFDLREELTTMRAYKFIEIKINPYPYGPSLTITEKAEDLMERFPMTLGKFNSQISFIAEKLGDKGVAELERLATALYVTKDKGKIDINERASIINELKPHVSLTAANEALQEIDEILSCSSGI